MTKHFISFASWLKERIGINKAAITINKYIPFFIEIDRMWANIPDYESLANHFGTGFTGLSKFRLPVKWLTMSQLITIDDQVRESVAAKVCIAKYLLEFQEGLFHEVIHVYSKFLENKIKENKMKVRSARIALTPAVGLLKSYQANPQELPTQGQIDQYLVKKHGQKNSLSGFINFLNKRYYLNLKVRVDPIKVMNYEKRRAEVNLVSIIKTTDGSGNEKKWVINALIYFHNVLKVQAYKIHQNSSKAFNSDGFYLEYFDLKYFIPSIPNTIGSTRLSDDGRESF
ncbi:hypothetical protein OS175_04250 [Marinicella sp. S1101]|nr:hypothetical protein [Marinicella marina]